MQPNAESQRAKAGRYPPSSFGVRPSPVGGGFTMVEVAVMLAMLALVSGIVLASFPRLTQRIGLQRSSQRLALSLRSAQNMAFAVREVDTDRCGRLIPPAFGVHLGRDATEYIVFADLRASSDCQTGANDLRYRADDDQVVATVLLDPGITVGRLTSDLGGTDADEEVLTITFAVPAAGMAIANASRSVGESAEVLFAGRIPDFRRGVIARTTGQIYVVAPPSP